MTVSLQLALEYLSFKYTASSCGLTVGFTFANTIVDKNGVYCRRKNIFLKIYPN